MESTIQATSALILKLTEKLPSSYWKRRRMLRDHDRKGYKLA
ncbi:MAG: hypothetical protein QW186_09700 [Candidatus Bathyarchaeia archaeon]